MSKISAEDFEIEFSKAQKKLFAVALSILRSVDLAEEAVSSAVLKAYTKRGTLKEPKYFQTWLVKILMNTCCDIQKQTKHFVYSELHETDLIHFDSHEAEFFSLISKLNENEKEIVVLRCFYQLQLDEIAKTLDKPLSTVKSTLYRALKRLKEELSDD